MKDFQSKNEVFEREKSFSETKENRRKLIHQEFDRFHEKYGAEYKEELKNAVLTAAQNDPNLKLSLEGLQTAVSELEMMLNGGKSQEKNTENIEWSIETYSKASKSETLDRARTHPEEVRALFTKQEENTWKWDFKGIKNAEQVIGLWAIPEIMQNEYLVCNGQLYTRGTSKNSLKPGFSNETDGYLAVYSGTTFTPYATKNDLPNEFQEKATSPLDYEAYTKDSEEKLSHYADLLDNSADIDEKILRTPEQEIDNGENLKGEALLKHPPFRRKLRKVCRRLGIQKEDLITVMKKESISINPKAVNPKTGATGLIQFMPQTARSLGTTVAKLRYMSGVEQLEYVEKYFKPYQGKLNSVQDLYMATFYPAALQKPMDFVIGSEKSREWAQKVARQNPAISKHAQNADYITKADFYQYVTA